MENSDVIRICKKINRLSDELKLKVRYGDILYYTLLYYEKKTVFQMLKAVAAPFFKYQYSVEGMGKIWMLFSSSYYKREGYKKSFMKVSSTISDKRIIQCVKRDKYDFSIVWKIFRLIKVFYLFSDLDTSFNLKAYIVCNIFRIQIEYEQLQKLGLECFDECKLLVTWCDCHDMDSLVTQIFNAQHIDTATLQHGNFNVNTIEGKYAYLMSKSRYFLCYGEFSKRSAMSLGLSEEKMILTGMPELIGTILPKKYSANKKNIFGVSLSSVLCNEENISLLKCANYIADKYGLKFKLRLHPSSDICDFKEFLSPEDMIEFCEKETMEEFYQSIDFVILGNSTVYLTMVSQLKPVFQYFDDMDKNMFKEINKTVFKNEQELEELYNDYVSKEDDEQNEELLALRKAIMGNIDTTGEYKRFFEKYE